LYDGAVKVAGRCAAGLRLCDHDHITPDNGME
jgi:hypothetical protein